MLIALILTFGLGSVAQAQICQGQVIDNLYRNVTNSLCSTEYALSLFQGGERPKVYNRDSCALSYLLVGGGSVAVGLGNLVKDELADQNEHLIKNTSANRKRFEDLIRRNNSIFDKDLLAFMKQNPNNHVWAEKYWNRYRSLRKGPSKLLHAAGSMGRRAAVVGMVTGIGAPVAVFADSVLGADSAACSELVHSFYAGDPDDKCRPLHGISPQLMNFLTLDTKSQVKLIRENPKLCDIYAEISQKLAEAQKKAFAGKISSKCSGDQKTVTVDWPSTERPSTVVLSGNKANIRTGDGKTLNVEYIKDADGYLHVKSVYGDIKMTSPKGVTPVRYEAPFDSVMSETKFHNTMKILVRHTQILEANNAFTTGCEGSSSGSGGKSNTHR